MAKIQIPEELRRFTENTSLYIAGGNTVGASLTELIYQFPEIKSHLINKEGKISRQYKVLLEENELKEGKELSDVNENSIIKLISRTIFTAN